MKLLIFSGSRADWSGLEWLGDTLLAAGHDVDVFKFWKSYEGKPNTPSQVAELAGMAFHEASNRLGSADLVFLLGDRYEVLAAAQAAYCMEVPIAHIAGGDVTLGSRDNAMRDAISMLASIHFATNEQSAARLCRMGAADNRFGEVYFVGSPAIDRIISIAAKASEKISKKVSRETRRRVIVSVHPSLAPINECMEILNACDLFEASAETLVEWHVMSPNADAGGQRIAGAMKAFCIPHDGRARYYENLPPNEYLELLCRADLIVGNSSAGLYEAPALGVPSVDVGDRQQGRPRALSVQGVEPEADAIHLAMIKAIGIDASPSRIYGDGHACERIVEIIGRATPDALQCAS